MCKETEENKECNCREIEKELVMSYYSQEDGNTYTLPFMNEENPNGQDLPLPDGSGICYENGFIEALFTGNRLYMFDMVDDERGVLTEREIVHEDKSEITRHINIFTLTSWTRFDCDPNTYVTDLGEEVHFCRHNDEPDYEGRIVKIIDPYGEVLDFTSSRT